MGMPNNLILIRHGQSEGNIVVEAAKTGDLSYYEQDDGRFMTVPGHQWRLTDRGRKQSNIIGGWVLDTMQSYGDFDRYYVSPYVRARETAAHLAIPGANWLLNRSLRERDWGDIGSMPREEFIKKYPDSARQKIMDPLYWMPPGGESIAQVAESRVRNVLSTLHRECDGKNVLAVTHGEMMWAFRLILEYWDDDDFAEADTNSDEKIYNCQAIHYTRLNPFEETQEDDSSPRLSWVRRATPVFEYGEWRINVSSWQKFDKLALSNESLLESVDSVPFLLESD